MSNDPPAANKAFRDKFSFNFDLLSDQSNATAMAYGAAEDASAKAQKRITFIIGPDARIVKIYGEVVAAENPEQVLGDL